MRQLVDRPVFEIDGIRYCWGDVVLFAMLTERWDPLEREIREGLACIRHAEAAGIDEPEEEIDAFAADFRYERELITADETEAWLAARGLGAGEWMEWARREVLRREWADQVADLVERYPVSQAEAAEAAAVDLLCGARSREWLVDLTGRAAAAAAMAEAGETFEAAPLSDAARQLLDQVSGPELEDTRARVTRLAGLEQAYTRFLSLAPTPDRVSRELDRGRLEWVRFDCRVIRFDTEPLAREAVLCVREDQLGIDEVAERAHAEVQDLSFYLGELDPDLRPRLLAAAPQDLVGPVPFENRYALFLVLDKLLPDEKAPELWREVEQRTVSRAVLEQVDRRVRWLDS